MKTIAIYERLHDNASDELSRSLLTHLEHLRGVAYRNFPNAQVRDFIDKRGKAKNNRPELDRLLGLCQHGQIKGVVFSGFSAVADGIQRIVYLVTALQEMRIPFVFVHENFDSRTGQGKAIAGFFQRLAETDQKWAQLAGRMVAGRPRKWKEKKYQKRMAKALDLKSQGKTMREIKKITRIPLASLHAYFKEHQQKTGTE